MKTEQFLNYTPNEVIGCRENKGNLFGVELEMEGRGVGLNDVATRGWTRHNDGSLRGDAIEYCTTGPKSFTDAQKLVKDLFKKLKDNGVKINSSIRTSTHVHLNFSDKKMKQVINFFSLFTVLEEVLAYYSGEDRKGNVFCLSTRDAEGIVQVLAEALATGSFQRFAGDRYKYAACNLSSLYKFGTVEVRTMRGAKTEDEVNNWLDILNDLYEYSLKMKSPVDIINKLSYLGAEGLMREVFKARNYDELMKTFPAPRTLHASLMDGVRIIQIFAFEFDPAFQAEVKVEKAAKKKGHAGPLRLYNPQTHEPYIVYLPDGRRWICLPTLRGRNRDGLWLDGERCEDNPNVIWRLALGRFVWRGVGGVETPLNWRSHEVFGDEGPMPRVDRAGWALIDPEEDEEVVDDWEPEEEDDF